jgi:hypothetical protein
MTRWFNPSHPQTLQAAVFLGYLSAVFGVLFSGASLLLFLFIGLGVGAFGSANNKRWGYYLLAGCALIVALFWMALLLLSSVGPFFSDVRGDLVGTLQVLNGSVFPIALAVAAIHPHSREYQKVWFE